MRRSTATSLNLVRAWGAAVLDFFYPPICPLCFDSLNPDEKIICGGCLGSMRLARAWRCAKCGAAGLGPEPEPGRPCRLCPPEGASWNGALAATGYHDSSARCVHLFKYNRRMELGHTMARIMVAELAGVLDSLRVRIDAVAPVPLHWRRRVWRGFNQSEMLSQQLAAGLDFHYEPKLLRRIKHTRRQTLLPREKRQTNVRNAFILNPSFNIAGKGILLVDDVVTTGETIGECARVLKESGAREVWIACFARASVGSPDLQSDDWLHDF